MHLCLHKFFYLFSFLIIKTLVAAEINLDTTIEYQSDDEKEIYTSAKLLADLQDHESVRYQIKYNLCQSKLYQSINDDVLLHPVICIGTGRNRDLITRKHWTPTWMQPQDICLDRYKDFKPDIVIGDAFLCEPRLNCVAKEEYHVIFFAHVGERFLPLEYPNELLNTLKQYYAILPSQGIFIFNSAVHQQKASTPQAFAQLYGRENFTELSHDVYNLFIKAGFVNIDILIKDEVSTFCKDPFSFLILAKKP